ncbi:MAG: MotA/TolQ/ExbB proton channel family protein [Bacteroidota bacterium]
MNVLESTLLAIANLLYYPVIGGVLFVLAHQAVMVGRFLSELKQRRGENFKRINAFKEQHQDYFKKPASTYKTIEFDLIYQLRKWQEAYIKSLSANRLVIKAGPSLGLMGTLIPMGTALASLSQGDLLIMSANMVTAFTTTIVGMAAGLTAFLMNYKQTEWMQRDLLECESLCERSLAEWEVAEQGTEKLITS